MNFSDLTTLKIGGPIKEVIPVQTEDEITQILKQVSKSNGPYLVIGGGSNLLVSDKGFEGTVIKNETRGIERDGNNLIAKSGMVLQDLVDFANNEGLAGLENLAGIPGTVGGAVYGNAGAYGQTISDNLVEVQILNIINHQTTVISKEDCQFDYRDSLFKKTKDLILGATFKLTPSDAEQLKKTAEETIRKREVKYPPGIKCPGSFFKNIPSDKLDPEVSSKIPEEFVLYGKVSAGALLESVGARGASIRNIKIADYHANLFINEGGGTAEDFRALAKTYSDKVFEKYGVQLEPEVQLINLQPLN